MRAAEEYFSDGKEAYKDNDMHSALRNFQQAMENGSSPSDIHKYQYWFVKTCIQSNQTNGEKKEIIQGILNLQQVSLWFCDLKTLMTYLTGQSQNPIGNFQEVGDFNGSVSDIIEHKLWIIDKLFSKNKNDQTLVLIGKLLKAYDKSRFCISDKNLYYLWSLKGLVFCSMRQFNKAIQCFSDATSHHDNYVYRNKFSVKIAILYLKFNKPESANEVLDRALKSYFEYIEKFQDQRESFEEKKDRDCSLISICRQKFLNYKWKNDDKKVDFYSKKIIELGAIEFYHTEDEYKILIDTLGLSGLQDEQKLRYYSAGSNLKPYKDLLALAKYHFEETEYFEAVKQFKNLVFQITKVYGVTEEAYLCHICYVDTLWRSGKFQLANDIIDYILKSGSNPYIAYSNACKGFFLILEGEYREAYNYYSRSLAAHGSRESIKAYRLFSELMFRNKEELIRSKSRILEGKISLPNDNIYQIIFELYDYSSLDSSFKEELRIKAIRLYYLNYTQPDIFDLYLMCALFFIKHEDFKEAKFYANLTLQISQYDRPAKKIEQIILEKKAARQRILGGISKFGLLNCNPSPEESNSIVHKIKK